MFRKKQNKETHKRIETRQKKRRTASKKIIIAIGCCFMTDVSIYIHITTPSF